MDAIVYISECCRSFPALENQSGKSKRLKRKTANTNEKKFDNNTELFSFRVCYPTCSWYKYYRSWSNVQRSESFHSYSWSFLPKTHLLDILEIIYLEMGQISSNLLKKAYATWQHAFLPTSTTFYDIFARACTEIKLSSRKWPPSLGFSIFLIFFRLSFFSLSYLLVAVIELLLGLLPVQKVPRKHHCIRQFLPWSSWV